MARTGLVNCGKKQRIFSRVCGNGKMVCGNGGVVGGNSVVVGGKELRLLGHCLLGAGIAWEGWWSDTEKVDLCLQVNFRG